MKRQWLAASTLLGAALAAPAHAQSSVQIGGYVDSYFQFVDTGKGTLAGLGNSALNQSRFFITGTEDLGGGTKAIFDLEAPFNINTGSGAAALFSNNAFLALRNEQYGELRMGRLKTLQNDILSGMWMARWGSSENAFLFSGNTVMNTNNTVRYETPTWGGLFFDAQWGFGPSGGSTGGLWEVKGEYNNGPMHVAAGFYRSKSGHDITYDGSQVSIITAGASYNFGVATPYVLYQRVFSTGIPGSSALRVNRYNLSFAVAIPLATQWDLRLDYGITRDSAFANANADSASARLDYSLSKLTILYTGVSRVWNGQNAYYQATSASGSVPISSVTSDYYGKASTSFIVGMRKAF